MKLSVPTLAFLPVMLLLAGCASTGNFPSLDIRDSERVTGTIAAPEGAIFTSTPATPATLADLDALAVRIRAAHQRFTATLDEARRIVGRAAGSGTGSDAWSAPQVAVANLESIRSEAMIALADIDRVHVDAHVNGGDIARSTALRAEMGALVAEEDRIITGLLQAL